MFFRKIGKPKVFPIIIFAISIYILVRKSRFKLESLIIDNEYMGHESAIKNIILILYRVNNKSNPNVYFANIGKNDLAHITAINIHRKREKENLVLTQIELQKYLALIIKGRK